MALDFLYSIARFGHSFVASSLSASFERKMSHFIDLRVLGTWNYEFYVQKKGSASSRFKKIIYLRVLGTKNATSSRITRLEHTFP